MLWFYPAFLLALFGQCFADLSSEYNHFVALDPAQKMKLYWTVNRTREEISFAVEASTTGWVGFGFSAGTGRMMGADIVIGWVEGGKPYLTDRHGEGHFLPTMDQSQDYKLISGTEKDGKTTLKFSRKIDTCDKNDIKIEEGTTKVIFGYSDEDPTSDLQINKHSYRDARSILLLNFGKTSQPDPSWEKMEFLMDNITVPEIKTSYMCKVFQLPDFVGKRHIVRFDPVVQPGNEGFVHHFVVNECQGSFPVHLLNFTSNCLDYANMPREVLKCKVTNILAGWGVGGGPFVYPEHVGYPIGMNNSARVIIVEIHYDNPEKIKGRLDSSGVRFYYTSDIRKYDVGLLSVGVDVTSWMVIPPKQDNWIVTGYCKKECTQKALESSGIPGKGIVLFSSFLHTHLAGSGAWTQHVRDGVQLQDIARDNYYDFNFQETQLLRKEIHFKPGDELIHQCKYNTLNRDKTTFGGVQTTDEMCINLLMYYPRIEGLTVSCSSNNLPATYKFLEKHYPNSKVHSHKWYNPLLHVKPKWTPRLVADYRAFLEKEEKISTCVKIANVTSFADVVNPKNLRDKVVINKPYVPPPSACDVYSSSKALRVGLVNVVLSAWIVGAALILL